MKDKKDNADLFSQPPLVIFTKGANISGGHCIYIYISFQCLRVTYSLMTGVSAIK